MSVSAFTVFAVDSPLLLGIFFIIEPGCPLTLMFMTPYHMSNNKINEIKVNLLVCRDIL